MPSSLFSFPVCFVLMATLEQSWAMCPHGLGNLLPSPGAGLPSVPWEGRIGSLLAPKLPDPVPPHGTSKTKKSTLCCRYVPPSQDLLLNLALTPQKSPKL